MAALRIPKNTHEGNVYFLPEVHMALLYRPHWSRGRFSHAVEGGKKSGSGRAGPSVVNVFNYPPHLDQLGD